ncbi:MAG: hypothetical protein BMS9Abin37_0715 [Acidobacteriota bacterium]|nr:MAG: hypothetical protein BMS9Abin37_0715 [Acidobacteriota bacterium]
MPPSKHNHAAQLATPVWELNTEEDASIRFRQYEDYRKANFDRPVDTIFDLSS